MQHSTHFVRAACAACTLALVLGACAPSASDSVSSAAASSEPRAASALSDTFRASDQYDYLDFDYSQSITADGLWEGVRALDYVTLPEDYAALAIPADSVTPSEDDVSNAVNTVVGQYATAALGDTVNIDYVGTVDGVAFTGGSTNGTGYDLTLGSGKFIDGFEDQIVGHKVGETFDVNVTFPEGYNDTTDAAGNTIVLSGADAVFSVTLNSITIGWELTDDWVAQNLEEAYDVVTVDQLKAYETNLLTERNKQNYAMNYLMEEADFADELPQSVLDYVVCQYLAFYNEYASYNSQTLEEFVTETIHYDSIDQMLADNEETILSAVQNTLLYQAIAEAAGLTLDANEAAQYESYVATYGQNYVNQFALNRQVLDWLVEHSTTA